MTKNTQPADKRQAKAVELVERHMSDRAARLITARVNASGVNTWIVNGHVVTITPFKTCDCPDQARRNPDGGCYHIRSVELLNAPQAAPLAPLPVEEWAPAGGWLSQRPRRRVEIEQEV